MEYLKEIAPFVIAFIFGLGIGWFIRCAQVGNERYKKQYERFEKIRDKVDKELEEAGRRMQD